ncbi:hypothetical protein [Nitrospirillum viridazoti]|uniref:Uncharacterized protein n=1 Tax=Nitrospirillum viridazoti CBAmc TaxID=1441467 RepID=A0A248JRQ5_9PROT|nr:hypothetical protein [Nitrospirillum amazonense]ASG21377.1 hypothetical protein Y958_11475 [Nitrospirillum amazonense CBAmc]TWB33053.1 hypothetical protein FBZ91_115115 [Nitrospirillum amazonense]
MSTHTILTPRYIHMLAPLLAETNPRPDYDLTAFYIEPHPAKGALIVAGNAHSMGMFHDADAICAAPLSVRLPRYIIDNCATMPLPELFDEGSVYTPSAPAWMVPDKLIITVREGNQPPAIAMVTHCSEDEDHRGVLACATEEEGVAIVTAKKAPDWRKLFPTPDAATSPQPIQLNPAKLADFRRITDAPNAWTSGFGLMIHHYPATTRTPPDASIAILRVPYYPNFIGALMGMRGTPDQNATPAIPDWLPAPATTPADEVAA